MSKKFPLYIVLSLLIVSFVTSCNSDDSESTNDVYSYSSTLLTTFKLEANDSVLYSLDSVYFTIDPDKRVVYNADSLPVGTKVSSLCVDMEFATAVSKAVIKITGSKVHKDTTFNYTGTSDSIDFSGNVVMSVTSYDGKATRDYTLKVNVHKVEPDSLYWNQLSRRDLPNVNGTAEVEKAVAYQGNYLCLLRETGNIYTLSTASNPGQGTWSKTTVHFPFTPYLPSFTATDDALYILDETSELYKSTDGVNWTDCNTSWSYIIGGYGSRLLGILRDGSVYKHDEYPRTATPTEVESNFPVSETSQFVIADNKWVVNPQGVIAGGRLTSGKATNTVWGFDGEQWGLISSPGNAKILPNLLSPVIFPYYTYYVNDTTFEATQHVTWFVMGGRLDDGSVNNVVYTSRDQGLLWRKGSDLVQLPSYMPAFYDAQAFVVKENLSVKSQSAVWTKINSRELPVWAFVDSRSSATMSRAPSTAITSWDCPYVYVFGGFGSNGRLLNNIWKGVLNRLTFKPVY
jgi:hypothetical protein